MGDCADDADRWAELQGLRQEFRELLRSSSQAYKEYTQEDFPSKPLYLIHQNNLMNVGYSMEQRMKICVIRYFINESAKVGDEIICPCCNLKFKKKGHSNCKDFFFNFTNPKRYERVKFFARG